MAERIRDLEDALKSLHFEHSACVGRAGSPSIHPLLREELLRIKGQYELYGLDSPTAAPAHAPSPGGEKDTEPFRLRKAPTSIPMKTDSESDASYSEPEENGANMRYAVAREGRRIERGETGSATAQPSESHMQMASRLRELLPDKLEAERLYTAACTNAVWM